MAKLKAITVCCGSSDGKDVRFGEMASELGTYLAENNITLVYGGAQVGLMGMVANALLKKGGTAIGVIPEFLSAKEIVHHGLSQLFVVDTMHERKAKMNEYCDGVIALPGGYGTLEELFEMLTWGQLGLHHKPIGVLNVNGYYDHLKNLLNHMVDQRLLSSENRDMLIFDHSVDGLIHKMEQYHPKKVDKWFGRMSASEI